MKLYGDVVSVPTTAPLTRKLTEETITLSLAVAESVTLPFTLAAFVGAVSVTVGGVVSNMLVVKFQEYVAPRTLPARSFTPLAPPVMVAV